MDENVNLEEDFYNENNSNPWPHALKGAMPLIVLLFGGPFVLIVLIIFLTYVFTHGDAFKASTADTVHWVYWLIGVCGAYVLGFIGVRLGRNAIAGWGDIGDARLKHAEARVKQAQADVAEIQARVIPIGERAVAIVQPDGEIEVMPLIDEKEVYQHKIVEGTRETEEPLGLPTPEPEVKEIPAYVRYSDISHYVKKDETLVGVDANGPVTREKDVNGLIWVPGNSGSGKTNSVIVRTSESYERGYSFLGIDPHYFKDDSLERAMQPFMDRFCEPFAHDTKEALRIIKLFLGEFKRRKAGSPCWPLMLLYDEVGSFTSDKPETEEDEEIIRYSKALARVAGQETRGYNLAVVMLSQTGTGLAWLRKHALMVLGHKMVMMNERRLVCNEHEEIARDMDNWPLGRTVVYGVMFQGMHIYQQPQWDKSPAGIYVPQHQTVGDVVPPHRLTRSSEISSGPDRGKISEDASEVTGRPIIDDDAQNLLLLKKFLNEAGKMRERGVSIDSILKEFGLPPGGRTNQNLKALLDGQQEVTQQKEQV